MKKLKYLIVTILLTSCFLPMSTLAVGSIDVSTTNLNITKGKTATFTVTANNAAGRIDISSSNPSVASVSNSSVFLDMQSSTITVTGNSAGTTIIKVQVTDATTYDDEDLSLTTYTITVNVTDPTSSNNNNNDNNSNNNNNTSNLSKNNKLKELSVEGFELVKTGNNNYTLLVSNDITGVNIKAIAEDNKAKISGTGSHELKIGENSIDIVVTSESGLKNKINIKVTRKDGYDLNDLEKLLNDSNVNDINVNINLGDTISSNLLELIKNSKKVVRLNYFDDNKKLVYSWIIDGSKIESVKEFSTDVSLVSENKQQIDKLSNYANGICVNIKHSGDLPVGTKIKLYVGDNYLDGNLLNVYYYNSINKKLDLIKDNLLVETGYIEFSVEHSSEYFITMSNIGEATTKNITSTKYNIFIIVSVIEFIIIVCMITFYILKVKCTKFNKNKSNITEKPIYIEE